MNSPLRHPPSSRAFTLIEAMVLVVVLSIVSVGVSTGLQSAVDVNGITDRSMAINTELISEAENWRAIAFTSPSWPTVPYSLSDTVTMSIGGTNRTFNRTTTIKNWDPSNIASNASPQSNFVQIQITVNGQTLTLYVCNLN